MKSARSLIVAMLVLSVPAMAEDKYAKKSDTPIAMTAEIGKPAPDFTLTGLDGKEVKLSSFKGKTVVLEWINHECPVCHRHYKDKSMVNTYNQFKNKNVVWLAIDSSNFCETKKEAITKWWKDQGMPFPYLLDAPGNVGKVYGAKTTPHMFVIDPKGILVYQGAIDDNPDGTKPKATNYVAEALTAIGNGSAVATATTKPYGCSVKYKN